TLTDNKNRTAADVRSTLTKLGGSLGATGSVSYMFETKGVISFDGDKYEEDKIFEAALELGAEDVVNEDGTIIVYTSPADFAQVMEGLGDLGFETLGGGIERVPNQKTALEEEKARKVLNIIDKLEELDDVQNVYSNLDLSGLDLDEE
ncbi:MAG TPA: YebC/PmpR family DNA-binding transcriptional regulator, partial [Spirochaetaceae bacterium]|nr:YebC/PmpR family DNA-binding transcriptional regulator [Spirochaetaceae bacterium]